MEYVGLKWYKCDFHLHTMKSKCYRDKDIDTPQSWVEEVKQKGLKCIANNTCFATHQGVKGLEFPRVMVIMDDAQARGFLFSYEKLFGAKAQSDTDVKNKREGKDTSITRTARLFYVACTRAQKSLAVVAYTANVESVKNTALSNGWFSEDEIYIL